MTMTFVPQGHITKGSELQAANRVKLEELLHIGRTKVHQTITKVSENLPSDVMAARPAFSFTPHDGKILMGVNDKAFSLHRHAVTQVAEFADVPTTLFSKFLDKRDGEGPWGAEMCAEVLQKTFQRNGESNKRFLVRHVGREARAVLSDKYRRLDSGLILEAYLTAAKQHGVLPYEGLANDTRWYIRGMLDRLIEPTPGQLYAYGSSLGHSDFGDGALEMRTFFLRLACTNGMMAENALRQVHLGKRLGDDITYSAETYQLDSRTSASAIRDIFASMFSEESIEAKALTIGKAHEERIDPTKAFVEKAAVSLGSKDLAKQIVERFTSADIEMMPPGQNKARWAQAAALLANSEDDVDKKVRLQTYAAQMMGFAT